MELVKEQNLIKDKGHEHLSQIKNLSNSLEITRQIRLNLDIYIFDIEKITSLKIPKVQKTLIKNFVDNNRVILCSAEERKKMRKVFSREKKELIATWENNTGREWPKYENNVYDINGHLYRQKGANYDVHHIIELKYGGQAIWWNAHPAASPDEHQYGIHRKDGVASKIFVFD